MPEFRKLSTAEVTELSRRQTNLADLREYIDYLKTLKTGDWGSIDLGENDSQRNVKRRTTTAAKSLNKTVRWRRSDSEKRIVFQVLNPK